VLYINNQLARKILPTKTELSWLTSVRDVRRNQAKTGHADRYNLVEAGRAVIMAKRLPPAGTRCQAHLVSLEHHYSSTADEHPVHNSSHSLAVVSLAKWDFTAEKDRGDLTHALKALDYRALTLPLDNLSQTLSNTLMGAVPVRHTHRSGAVKAAWYAGPMTSFPSDALSSLPVMHAGELTLTNNQTGMDDITYSAAWELGRLMVMKDSSLAVRLHHWKRRQVHAWHAKGHRQQLQGVDTTELSFTEFPSELRDWFIKSLFLLEDVPFNYLVPDPRMLKTETLAQFQLDPRWISCVMDGAFSVGRANAAALEEDRWLLRKFKPLPELVDVHGILLRSHVVKDFPDLIIDAIHAGAVQKPVRYERLNPETLLILWGHSFERIEMHLHTQALHFGLDRNESDTGFIKAGEVVTVHDGVVDIANLAALLAGNSGAGKFAMQMIEPVPKVAFVTEVPR